MSIVISGTTGIDAGSLPVANTRKISAGSELPVILNTAGVDRVTVDTAGNVGIGTSTPAVSLDLSARTDAIALPRGTTAQRPSSASIGMIRYNTNIEALENYTSYGWTRVSVPMPIINSVTNYIYSGYQSTITLNGINFETAQGSVAFISGATTVNVNATPTNDTAVSILVPSSIYSLASGTTVSIKYINADGGVSSQFNVTVASIPTGGTVTTSGGYIYHIFNASSTNFVTPASWTTKTVSYLCVAGGGGGGSRYGGGGGGGGYISSTYSVAPSSTYTVIVGGGGAGGQISAGSASTGGVNGSNSSVFGATAIGGGGGGSADVEQTGKSGGSGGGGQYGYYGGSGTSGQGNKGGNGGSVSGSGTYQYEEGGGGGAGAAGENGNTTTGQGSKGGVGLQWLNGSYYAGGGGGGSHNPAYVNYVAAGGNGGGGNSGTHGYKSPGVNASANTGGGGGGSATDSGGDSTTIGGNGGSGIVIIRYSL